VNGLFVDSSRLHVVVRLRNPDINKGGESWRVFNLSTGDDVATVDAPRPDDSVRTVMDVRIVPDTPLVLMHWWHFDNRATKNPGGVFTLVDLSDPKRPAEVWRQVLAGDYVDAMERVRKEGAILRCDQPRRFDLHFVAEKSRVGFEVTPGPNGLGGEWVTREVAREPYEWPPDLAKAAPAPAKLAEIALKSLGEVKLVMPAPPATQPVRDVWAFDVDDRGRVGFVRGEQGEGGGCSFVVVDANGKPVVDVTRLSSDTSQPKIAWLTGDRWVVTASRPGHDKQSRAWFVDIDAAKRRASLQPIEKFEASKVESLCATGDGGFAALCARHERSSITDELYCYDKSGRRRWMIQGSSGNNSILFSPKAVAFDPTGGGSIVVLENIRNKLQLLSPHGERRRTIDLKQSFGKKPNYPTDVTVTSHGTFVIHDFNGSPPVWWLKNDGSLLDRFRPHFPDGRKLEIRDLRIGPKDRIWASDGSMLVRLDEKGVVDLALGATPGADVAEQAGDVAFGKGGEIHLASSRGGVVRVFDSSGKLLRTLKPDAADFGSNTDINRVLVDGEGDVYVAAWDGPYLRLRSDGTRVGWEKQSLDTVREKWAFQPGTRKRWVAGYENVWLTDEAGKPLRQIRRQPDRRWLAHPDAIAVAPDGSLAVSASDGMRTGAQGSRLNIYSPAGEPVRTIPLPDGQPSVRLAFDGRRAVIAQSVRGGTELFLVTVDDGSLKRLTLDGKTLLPDGHWVPAFGPDGRELWLTDLSAKEKSIRRFAVGG
jgi:sugar lactone lactonase YvrE